MTPDKADVGAVTAFLTGVGSYIAQLNDAVAEANHVAAEYLPLITFLSMVTGIIALAVKVWQVKVTREQRRRDRALRHKELEHEARLYGRRRGDEVDGDESISIQSELDPQSSGRGSPSHRDQRPGDSDFPGGFRDP